MWEKWLLAGKRKVKAGNNTRKFSVKLRHEAAADCRKGKESRYPHVFVMFIFQICHRKRGACLWENSGFWFELHFAVQRIFLRFRQKFMKCIQPTWHANVVELVFAFKNPHTPYGFKLMSDSFCLLYIFLTAFVWLFSRYAGLFSSQIPRACTCKLPEGCERTLYVPSNWLIWVIINE